MIHTIQEIAKWGFAWLLVSLAVILLFGALCELGAAIRRSNARHHAKRRGGTLAFRPTTGRRR